MRLVQRRGRGAAGTEEAPPDFQEFVAAAGTQLLRTACLLTGGDAHAAEDLVQETFGAMYRRWHRGLPLDNPVAYAQTTLANRFVSSRRKRSNGERPVAADELAGVADRDADRDADGDGDVWLRMTLLAALRALPPVDRAVLVLRFWEDLSVAETAARLGLTEVAVRSRCARALARVRAGLGAEFADLMRF